MRRFTVQHIGDEKPRMVVFADYMTRDSGYPNTLHFWIRRRWWQFDQCVGTFEAPSTEWQCSSEEVKSDAEIIANLGVRP